jgi:predicted anti-sigma-YlaC factor YlaD
MQRKLSVWDRSRLKVMNAMQPVVMPCSEATRLVSDSMDGELSFRLKVRVRLHLALCKWCRRFEMQLALMRSLISKEEETDAGSALSDDAKESIKQEMLRKLS